MILNSLLKELGLKNGSINPEITFITERLQEVKPGTLFAAVEGAHCDGNSCLEAAFAAGAVAAISEKCFDDPRITVVRDVRLALSFLCSAFYSYPQQELKIIGVTGTNGKTTTAEYISHILKCSGKKCGVIGTLGTKIDGGYTETGCTTPSGDKLFSELRKMADAGCEYCIMEVSSQALAQKRVEPITFALSVFTNIGREHIDYHGSFENYIKAKARLITLSEALLINADDIYCEELENEAGTRKCSLFSAKGGWADFMAKNIRFSGDDISYLILSGSSMERFNFSGIGEPAVYNTLAAAGAAFMLGIDFSAAARALSSLPPVKGRAEHFSAGGIDIYIDFAHTAEALSAMLEAVKNRCSGRLICVFGCGGDRYKGKRSEMGRVASSCADCVIITSDNPRGEAPEAIADDILSGCCGKASVFIELDREKAVLLAINKAASGDAVLLAGMGNEKYLTSSAAKQYLSDEDIVKKILGI